MHLTATRRALVAITLVLLGFAFAGGVRSQTAAPVKIAVFDFELEDKSAGAGIIPPDAHDIRYLGEATDQAKRMLAATGHFEIVETTTADLTATKQFGLRNCGGCEAGIARKLGADQAMIGVVTRVNRTEFTLFMRILDTASGKPVSSGFTDLRMGANYAWPRGVKWLMTNRMPAAKTAK